MFELVQRSDKAGRINWNSGGQLMKKGVLVR
jgi:hypothetical protein